MRARGVLRTRLLARLAFIILANVALSPAIAELPALRQPSIEPSQAILQEEVESWQSGGYTVEPLAEYEVTARVLSARSYSEGREAEVSPIDFALGWGSMAERDLLSRLQVTQSDRWYYVRWRNPGIDPSEVIANSANTHVIPSSPDIEEQLSEVQPGDMVTLSGYLVTVRAEDGWKWRSSLSRMDTGDGSCEVLWVESVEVESDAPISYASME